MEINVNLGIFVINRVNIDETLYGSINFPLCYNCILPDTICNFIFLIYRWDDI